MADFLSLEMNSKTDPQEVEGLRAEVAKQKDIANRLKEVGRKHRDNALDFEKKLKELKEQVADESNLTDDEAKIRAKMTENKINKLTNDVEILTESRNRFFELATKWTGIELKFEISTELIEKDPEKWATDPKTGAPSCIASRLLDVVAKTRVKC